MSAREVDMLAREIAIKALESMADTDEEKTCLDSLIKVSWETRHSLHFTARKIAIGNAQTVGKITKLLFAKGLQKDISESLDGLPRAVARAIDDIFSEADKMAPEDFSCA